jgi:hypothetical protein
MSRQEDEITPIPPQQEKAEDVIREVEREYTVSLTLDDRVEPTDEDLATLRRVSEIIPLRAW